MAFITIASTALPNPSEYSVARYDLDSDTTMRSESGMLQRDRVRAGIYKITVKFRVTGSVLKTITDAIAGVSFQCTFFDPTTSSSPTKTMYAGDRTGTLVVSLDGVIATSEWDLEVALIEF